MSTLHRPRKRFGQNFLIDQNVVNHIIAAAELSPSDHVLEIGPGQGALTHKMLPLVQRLDLIEIDRDLAQQFTDNGDEKLHVHVGDALKIDWNQILNQTDYKLVANLPYNISSQVLFKMITHRQLISRMILMFQKEVGDRLRAQPGSKEYGSLTVLCQLWFDISRVTLVPPSAFKPPPKVMSEVLRFDRRETPRVEVDDDGFFRRVVKASFAQRRKTLRNCLCAAGFSAEVVDITAEDAQLDMKRRGETLSITEFAHLAKQLQIVEQRYLTN
ncbi:MAG: 16S rRNA (adenine(1518)-N(6)/adenine(1519)-N(6))-dimethyltransferase RsmA [Deltaproteobacteria bacterium]|jgi:16S rRNA (adenine1518-N6/adenine1519-N6)-dimethyltransferase|nr:16S rRNA (adenine(1518)-N(6)/adenine(1519)-N(6))-dimethyltransferase RsmA [Deltaproteobacteria bacterium]